MKLEAGSTNPIAPDKYITLIKTTLDLCNKQNSKSNFVFMLMIDTFEKSTNVKLNCPLEKNVYRMSDWLIDANKILPKSLSFPANVSVNSEFLTKSNSSSKRIQIFSLKLLLEVKK
jgi:hypothetical protein